MARTYEEMRRRLIQFIEEEHWSPNDVVRIGKDLCKCGSCRFFVEHYDKEGKQFDIWHCSKGNVPRAKSTGNSACGYWEEK